MCVVSWLTKGRARKHSIQTKQTLKKKRWIKEQSKESKMIHISVKLQQCAAFLQCQWHFKIKLCKSTIFTISISNWPCPVLFHVNELYLQYRGGRHLSRSKTSRVSERCFRFAAVCIYLQCISMSTSELNVHQQHTGCSCTQQ